MDGSDHSSGELIKIVRHGPTPKRAPCPQSVLLNDEMGARRRDRSGQPLQKEVLLLRDEKEVIWYEKG
jgi:hypothetical protein